jgi:LPXTG-motif cell wall-anchored protein
MWSRLIGAAFGLGLMGGVVLMAAPAGAFSGPGAPVVEVSVAHAGAAPAQQPSPSDAPTGVTPAPTGTATPVQSSPPAPGGPGNTDTGQQSDNDATPLVIGGVLILIILLAVFYLWRRREAVKDL